MEEASLSFEQQWNKQFAEAELAPPPHVWTAIDGQLAQGEADAYKSQATTYRWLAAACFLLLMLFGWNYWSNETSTLPESIKLASEPVKKLDTETIPNPTQHLVQSNDEQSQSTSTHKSESNRETIEALDNQTLDESIAQPNNIKLLTTEEPAQPYSKVKSGSRNQVSHRSIAQSSTRFLNYDHKNILLPSLVNKLNTPEYLYGVPVIPTDQAPLEINNLWAGITMSTGVFDPQLNIATDDNAMAYDFADSEIEESIYTDQQQAQNMNNRSYENVGQSKSGGINVGTKRKKLLFSSGLILNAYSSEKSSVAIVENNQRSYALSGNQNDEALSQAVNSESIELTNDFISLTNEFRYLTIPLQVGYALRDKAFYINLNSGLLTNFLLNAEMVSNSDTQSLENDLDISNDYNAIYLDLMMSLEFGYVFAKKYQLLLEPNYKRAITDFSNTSNTDQRKPNNLGIAIGLKYNF